MRLAIYAVAFVAAALVGTHGIAYWDAGDYVRLAIEGGKSGLLLGRPLFLWISRAIVALSGPAHAEPVLRWFWTAVSATAAPLLATLATAVGLPRRAAIVAGFSLALSPSFAHTSHQVLTDGPALAASLGALVLAARGRAALAGVALAVAIATRETAAVHAIAIVILLRRRAAIALGIALVVVIVLALGQPGLLQWGGAMRQSSSAHPLALRDVGISLGWILAAGPLPVLLGFRHLRAAHPIVWPAAIATLLLIFYPDGSFSPRYVLATAPLLFLSAAPFLGARWTLAALIVPIALTKLATRRTDAIAARGAEAMRTFGDPPARAVVVPGHYCPHVRLALSLRGRRDVDLICPGWEWPADPARTLEDARTRGRPIVLDLRQDAWVGPRERVCRDAVSAYAASRGASLPIVELH